jgi:hypothetical protein
LSLRFQLFKNSFWIVATNKEFQLNWK